MATNGCEKPFDRILNFRDVGKFLNHDAGQQLYTSGLLFRSAAPGSASPEDRTRLVNEYRIQTIIDLRTPTEHAEAKRKHGDDRPTITGIQYREINMNGSAYSNALIKQLSWTQRAKLYSLYIAGWRLSAISVLGENVIAKRGLAGLAEDSLVHSTAEVKAIFDILADADSYPVLIHCTQGKDRTGLVVLLVLLLLDAPMSSIERDYTLSQSELLPQRSEKLAEIASIGLPTEFADCPADWVEKVSGWIDEQHGDVESYLQSCGVTGVQCKAIRTILLS